jgi:hypothetical protein
LFSQVVLSTVPLVLNGTSDPILPPGPVQSRTYKGKAIPLRGRGIPCGCETSRLPHFLDNRLTDGGEVFRLTLLPPSTQGRFLVLISARGSVDSTPIARLEGLSKLKNYLIGNLTCDLTACSIVPESTTRRNVVMTAHIRTVQRPKS